MSTYEEPLKIIVSRPMGESKVANYIIPGYLAPREEIFRPLVEKMVGGVYIVSYKGQTCRAQVIAKQLRQILQRHDGDITVRLFGLSLGANIACLVARAPLKWHNPVEIYAICPLLHHLAIKQRVLRKTRILALSGRMLATIVGRRYWRMSLVKMYDEPRSLIELLSGAEEIIWARAPILDSKAKLWVLFSRDDQYLDREATRKYARKISKNSQFLEVAMKHCWEVEIPLRANKQIELKQQMGKLISQLTWNTPAFSEAL